MADHAGFDPSEVFLYTGKGRIPRNAVRAEVHRSVAYIPKGVFSNCRQLESVLLHEGLWNIGTSAFFWCSSLRVFRCPSTVKEIGLGAFQGCSNLAVVELPEGLDWIKRLTFVQCTSLEELKIPASVYAIDPFAFGGCTNLASVGLGEGLRAIGDGAFAGCRSLGSLRVPSSVDRIGVKAFDGCSRLTSIQLREDLPTMKRFAFRGCPPGSFRFVRLSERMEAIGMDDRTRSMFDGRLSEITRAMTAAHDEEEEAEALWEKCKMSLGRAHKVLTYVELKGGAPVLELALWKARIEGDPVDDEDGRLSPEDCRIKCGAGVVLSEVLKFFAYSTSWPQLEDQS